MPRVTNVMKAIWDNIISDFESQELPRVLILSVLIVVTVLALYEYVVYRFVLKRSLYDKAFNISLAVIPYFIAMIILCLQSNMVITLGTIGALAIIRFRNAVKDPMDLVFLLWSIFIGISCGCQLYSMAIVTSVVVTVILMLLTFISIRTRTHILVVRLKNNDSWVQVEECIGNHSRRYHVKSRNYSTNGVIIVTELLARDLEGLVSSLRSINEIENISLMDYDNDDII